MSLANQIKRQTAAVVAINQKPDPMLMVRKQIADLEEQVRHEQAECERLEQELATEQQRTRKPLPRMSIYTPPALNAVDFAVESFTPADLTPAGNALAVYAVPALNAVDFALTAYTPPTYPYVGWELLPGATYASGAASANGASTVIAVGADGNTGGTVVAGAASSAGTSSSIMTGAAIATAVLNATGTSQAQAVGAAIAAGVVSAAGSGVVLGAGASIASAVISAAGTSTAEAVGEEAGGATIVAAAGSASGTSTAEAVGSSITPHDYYQDGYRIQKRGREDEELMAMAALLCQVVESTYYGSRP